MASPCAWRCSICLSLAQPRARIPPSRRRRSTIAAQPTECPQRTLRMLLVKNGRVLDPASNTDAPFDLLLDGEKIAELAAPGKLAPEKADVFDASGLIVAPGFIDLHAHLREPGQ